MMTGEWTLRSRRVVTPSGTRPADVVIRNEAIAAVADYDGPESEGVILDVGDLMVLPGLVALHRNGPLCADGAGFESVTKDAGAGGVTTLVDLPPDEDQQSIGSSAVRERIVAADGRIRVDCGLVVGLGHGNADRIESWVEAGVIGVEAVLGSPGPVSSRHSTVDDLRAAMPTLARLDRPLLVHAERANHCSTAGGPQRFGDSLPKQEFELVRVLIRLCRESRCAVHLIHPTASEALPMIAQARAEGLPLSVETCPHHLSWSLAEIADGVPTFPLYPRMSAPDVRDRLWEGLRSGLIDAVGSDHPPPRALVIPPRGTPGEVRPASRGSSSLRSAISAVWTEARRQGFTPDDLARWMAGQTAQAFGLARRKGSIAPGLDADFVVFDPDETFVADPAPHHRRTHSPPVHGRMLTGRVEATILRGSLIYQGGQFNDDPRGSVVLRLEETLPMDGSLD